MRCDPKRRIIAVPSVRDQVVHHLIIQVIGPPFERQFHSHSYASRPEKGVLVAVETVHHWSTTNRSGIDADAIGTAIGRISADCLATASVRVMARSKFGGSHRGTAGSVR
ncbi:hypothetical protein HY634_01840 [Candidatus Uhrbacteria bacterium]|nr:hypothetical protein [Candidatus Uhrbacteria bacterium]